MIQTCTMNWKVQGSCVEQQFSELSMHCCPSVVWTLDISALTHCSVEGNDDCIVLYCYCVDMDTVGWTELFHPIELEPSLAAENRFIETVAT